MSTTDHLKSQLANIILALESARHHVEEECCDQRECIADESRGLVGQVGVVLDYLTGEPFPGVETMRDEWRALTDDERDEQASDFADDIERLTDGAIMWDGDAFAHYPLVPCEICEYAPDGDASEAVMGWLDEKPLELVAEVGRPLTVVFTTGGPHVEATWDLSYNSPVLEGRWGFDEVRHVGAADPLRWVMHYFFDEIIDLP